MLTHILVRPLHQSLHQRPRSARHNHLRVAEGDDQAALGVVETTKARLTDHGGPRFRNAICRARGSRAEYLDYCIDDGGVMPFRRMYVTRLP